MKRPIALCLMVRLAACTEPAAVRPIAGTFALNLHFVAHRQTSFVCSQAGCTITGTDSTGIDDTAVGTIAFDSLATGASVRLSLGQCGSCLIDVGSVGHALRRGDSITVGFGGAGNPSFQLLGVYRDDGISGQIQSMDYGSNGKSANTYWGTFVAKPAE